MPSSWPNIRLHGHDGDASILRVRDGLGAAFYMRRSHDDVKADVVRGLESYRLAIAPHTLGWYADDHGDWQPLDAGGWRFVEQRLSAPRETEITLLEDAETMTGYRFSYHGRWLEQPLHAGSTAVGFWLPTEDRGAELLRKAALEVATLLPFDSGHAGLCFQFTEDALGLTDGIRPLAFRYPGLDIPELRRDSLRLGTRLQGTHWMTFLGPTLLAGMGGVEALRNRLHSPGSLVEPLPSGRAVVTLGERPLAGDSRQGENMEAYRELARLLEPWMDLGRDAWDGFSEEDMRRWERRFLD
ncbi:type VI immunity family protein [Corallococcus llansteffanensis]|uniref:DUF3396 domain-containing protein n=1 Tax=Corallococcus llansteffanensis TaxID=2316731 RepID=A0A3A8P4M5_9BACT|nr:type VI immunity family protein [Corallococcus llansteffanensis]RKH46694.1 DUF3396 domain-containing protein [Corallococcus llansteffanensis]